MESTVELPVRYKPDIRLKESRGCAGNVSCTYIKYSQEIEICGAGCRSCMRQDRYIRWIRCVQFVY